MSTSPVPAEQPQPHPTGIGKRVAGAMDKMVANDPEGALFEICAAIDRTAQREIGGTGRRTYKDFIIDSMPIISRFGFGGGIGRINVAYRHPDMPVDAQGYCALEDIFYHAIRCGLYHSAEMPMDILFIPETKIICEQKTNRLKLPLSLIQGFIMAVVTAPSNAGEKILGNYIVWFGAGAGFHVDSLWGKRREVLWLLNSIILRQEGHSPTKPS